MSTPTPAPKGATHSMEHADRAHSDISAKISRLLATLGEDDARRLAGPMLLASAYAEIDRLKSDIAESRALASEWRGRMCSDSELADTSNGFAFPWEDGS